MASKGKGVARENYSAKRKRGASGDDEKTGGALKSRNRSVLQFFEDEADDIDVDWTDDSDFDHDFIDDEPSTEPKVKNDMGKGQSLPLFPKSEEMEEEEFDKMMEGQYGDGSRLLHYTENKYDDKSFVDESSLPLSYKDPITWKVKCMVGRERQSVFCLMQKFVELKSLGTKLQILSAFAVEHIKGFVFIETEKQNDVIEACKGIGNIYVSRMASVPQTDVSHYLSVQNKCREISEGMWARVKSGKYKGDLAQIVSVNNNRKRATVKLIPRIDLKAMAEKFGGGTVDKRTSTPAPAPKLISSSELEEFRPLIQCRRDRETGKVFQFFDGLMLKDGYLFKKVSLDSLNCWSVIPTEEEVLKFKVSENNESDNLGWLSQLYGEQKKKPIIRNDKGGGKGEGSSGSSVGFELYVLVCFGRKEFGVIVGTEKDDSYKILKDSPEGPTVVNVRRKDLKYGPFFDTKFTAADLNKKTLNVNDSVKVLEGPSQGKEGIVKYIYRNTVFIHDEIEEVNGGYLCCKAQMCEKIKFSYDAEKCGEMGSSGFEDIASSPKSPLSPEKPWQTKENKCGFNRGENDGMFSIGQTLRIRVGPLKGYLCRVLAIRRLDVTVKLDSQQKILTVKSEHLSEVREKSTMTLSEDPKSISKFDLLGTDGDSKDWLGGGGTSAGNDNWTGGLSTERSSWPSFPASSSSLQPGSNSANSLGPGDDANNENTPWESKVVADQSSSWGAAESTIAVASGHGSDWGKIESGKDSAKTSFNACASGGWENPGAPASGVEASDCWGKGKSKMDSSRGGSSWASGSDINVNRVDGETSEHSWDKKSVVENKTSSWGASTSVCMKANESTKYGLGWNNGWGDDKKADACAKICESSKLDDSVVKALEDGWNVRKTADGGSSSGWNQSTSIAAPSASSKRPDSDWGLKGDCNAPSSEMSLKQDTHLEGQSSRTLGSNDIGSKEGKEINWTGFSGSKKNWGSASADGCQKQDSDWGKKGNNGSDEAGHNQVSDWGKKGDWDSVSGHNEKKTGGNQNSNWENSGQNQASNWGKKGNWNSGSSDRDVNQNSNQVKTDDWNFGSGCASEKSDFTEGNRSNWNSESGDTGKDGNSAWGNKSTWNSGSNWGEKSNWNNGNNSTSNQSSGEDQTEIDRGRGNWRGGFGGRDDSDDGFRGRGGFGGRRGGRGFGGRGRSDGYGNDFTSNQSSSENQTETNDSRGNWRGGFGGRDNSDRGFRGRGGFGGRRGGRGFGGGGRSDESSFGDRNESGRGGYGGRGRGRRDWNSDSGGRRDWNNDSGGKRDWNNDSGGSRRDWNNDSGGSRGDWKNESSGSKGGWNNDSSKLSSWGGESNNEGWKNNGSSGTWKGGSDEKNQQKTWNSGNDGASNTAGILGRHPTESGGGVNSWDKGKGLNAKNTGWTEPSNQSDGWNKESEKPANSWRMSDTSGGAGWSKGTSSTSEKGSGSAWGDEAANPLDKGEAPSWGKPEDKKEECGRWGNEATNKGEASSSWGKQNEGNKGVW